tara:strand:- start:58 stop:516 length:459 start_codon:yes stop_codon:yes gene_type:complete
MEVNKMKKIMIYLVLVSTILIVVGCSGNSGSKNQNLAPGETIAIPLNTITSQVQKFDYDADGTIVTYFAVKGSDGEVRTAFDACDVCGGYKGYTQKGNDIECDNCGRVFSIDGLGTKNKGYGCWPSYLSHDIKNGNVIISKKELAAGSHRFV